MDNLNQPNTLIFHPGIGKTATSSIQKVGLSLPTNDTHQACFSPYGIHGYAHNLYSSVHPGFKQDVFNREWAKLLDFAINRQSATVVSSEFLIRDKPQHIKHLIESAKQHGLSVKVIVSIREYTDYLMSSFLQGVKVNWGIKNNENFIQYCQREIENIRYTKLIHQWSNHCGDNNTYILNYSELKELTLPTFFSSLGLKSIIQEDSQEKSNPSIPFEIFPIVRHLDKIIDNKKLREDIIAKLSNQKFKGNLRNIAFKRAQELIVKEKYNNDLERLKIRYQLLPTKSI